MVIAKGTDQQRNNLFPISDLRVGIAAGGFNLRQMLESFSLKPRVFHLLGDLKGLLVQPHCLNGVAAFNPDCPQPVKRHRFELPGAGLAADPQSLLMVVNPLFVVSPTSQKRSQTVERFAFHRPVGAGPRQLKPP